MKINPLIRIFYKFISASLILMLALPMLHINTVYAATIVVTTETDETTTNSSCSLREAMTNAENDAQTYPDCLSGSGSDTITFNIANATPSITLTATLPTITDVDGLVINGANTNGLGGTVTLNGNNTVRIMNMTGGTATLQNLTLLDGGMVTDVSGAGINISGGTLTISTVTFNSNEATNDGNDNGGAIFQSGGSVIINSNSLFTGNTASGNGGAIYVSAGDLSISSSTFTGNSASAGDGGAIYNLGNLTVTNSIFTSNEGLAAGSDGGVIFHNTGTLSISNSTFGGNLVSNGNRTGNNGGALYINGGSGTMTIIGTTFKNNNDAIIDDGGALYINNGTVTISDSDFESNAATLNHGGALYVNGGTVTVNSNSTFTSNTSILDGGAIRQNGGTLSVIDTTFTSNAATRDGGAITVNNGTLSVSNSTFTSNNADDGGAIFHSTATLLTVTDSTFTSNQANGEIGSDGGAIKMNNAGSSLVISGSTFTTNSSNDDGGAIQINSASATISGSTFTGNTANDANSSGSRGGAILNSGTAVATKIILSSFINNTAQTTVANFAYGGAITNLSDGMTIANVTFSGNQTTKNNAGGGNARGGAIWSNSDITIHNATFSGNSTSENGTGSAAGGTLYRQNGTFTVANSILLNGQANGSANNCGGTITDGGNNIDFGGGNNCGVGFTNSDPLLGSLTGSPQYFPLNTGSPALDAGSNAICATVTSTNNESQNGVTRPVNTTCDIGSYEGRIPPTITSATYDANTGDLVVTGNGMNVGDSIDLTKLTLTGEGGSTYTLTDVSGATASNSTTFSITLNATDKAAVNLILNKNGLSSTGGTTYNLAAADDWDTNYTTGDTSDATNAVTVSNVPVPTITSATYNASTGVLVVTGTGLLSRSGAANDIDASTLTLTGESGTGYTLTDTADVEITSGTQFTLTLSATDKAAVNLVMNKNGTNATDGQLYNLAGAEDWNTGADATVNIADATNLVTVSGVAAPTITSATYDVSTGALVVTGTGLLKFSPTSDIDASLFTFTGDGGSTYTLTDTSDVEITSGTQFTLNLSVTDKAAVDLLLNKNGTSSLDGTTYNLAAAEDWNLGADAAVNIADLTGNGITVSGANDEPNAPSSIDQYKTDASTVITQGGATNETSVVFKATATDPESDQYKLEVEVAGNAGAFTDTATCSSSLTNSGVETSTGSCGPFVAGSYKWQYRLIDSVGASTAWTAFAGSDPDFIIDTGSPVVTDVTSTDADGTYFISDVITITVQFNEIVNLTPACTPQLTLELGSVDGVADYTSGTGTNTLTFTYTVVTGDVTPDLDYVDTSSLSLNDCTSIQDAALNDVDLTLPTPGAAGSLGNNKDIVIDGTLLQVATDGINSNPDTGDGSISESEVIPSTLGITQIIVEFNKDVYNPAGDSDTEDVTNPANYLLLRSTNGTFNTLSCLVAQGGIVAPDIQIPISSVTYDNSGGSGPFVATLNLASSLTTDGYYRLFVCGTTSIVQANSQNQALAGDGINSDTDFLRNFQINTIATNDGGGNGDRSLTTLPALLPATGFAPNVTTTLPVQSDAMKYAATDVWLEIPSLKISTQIVGVPLVDDEWNLSWLGNDAGWLEGSAFPSWNGNSVLTGHVTDFNGKSGVFANLGNLKWGDRIIIHAYGGTYTFEVRENKVVSPTSVYSVLRHEDNPWLTLITCKDYNEDKDTYQNRISVRAVLVGTGEDRSVPARRGGKW